MNCSNCNTCGGPSGGCGSCGQCQPKCGCENSCAPKCGCPDAVLSIEADSVNPSLLRFNFGGRSVWFDFSSVVKNSESCTSIIPDVVNRLLRYNAECQENEITASELGSIFHLADIGDIDATTLKDNAILVYRKDADCGENCDGKNGWIGLDPSEAGDTSLSYIMGADEDGKVESLMPPSNSNQFYTLTWAAQGKASWKQPTEVSAIPVDSAGYSYQLYLDPNTKEIVIYKKKES